MRKVYHRKPGSMDFRLAQEATGNQANSISIGNQEQLEIRLAHGEKFIIGNQVQWMSD